jgi:hypothetical protein
MLEEEVLLMKLIDNDASEECLEARTRPRSRPGDTVCVLYSCTVPMVLGPRTKQAWTGRDGQERRSQVLRIDQGKLCVYDDGRVSNQRVVLRKRQGVTVRHYVGVLVLLLIRHLVRVHLGL